MIEYKKFTLDNGLKVLVHEDHTTPMAVLNILYDVGSKDEEGDKTGFAHLFEHLMFGGSKHIKSFDEPLQKVGGENNAFTSPDITNYYITLPAVNIETAFWLESDRMLGLSFDPQVLEIQRKVVIEEFKQRYLNQPYGDVWLKMRPLAYKTHPYKWATIGKDISHIENATMEDVRSFFKKFYHPNNAYLVVAGNVTFDQVKHLTEKWFGPIPSGEKYVRDLPVEPLHQEKRTLEVKADVPLNAFYKAYHMPSRTDHAYYQVDLLSDILGRGHSSRLYEQLVKEKKLFNSLHAYVTGSSEPGLLVFSGKLNEGISMAAAEEGIEMVINNLKKEPVKNDELEKVKNQAETSKIFGDVELLNRAMNLAYASVLGDPELVNTETSKIQAVTSEEIQAMAHKILREDNSSVIYYYGENN